MSKSRNAPIANDREPEDPSKVKGPVYGYVRVSSAEQRARRTIESQVSELTAWSQTNGVVFEEIIADDGHSASTVSGRPGFKRLLQLCRDGRVGTLATVAPDRITRSSEWSDRALVWDALRKHRTLLVLTAYGSTLDAHSEMSDMILGNLFAAAAAERRRLLDRTSRGKTRAAQNGRLTNGAAPYGLSFDKVGGVWTVNVEQAGVLKQMFDWCLEGHGSKAIARMLNEAGVPAPRGAVWQQGSVLRLLRSRTAVGEYAAMGRVTPVPIIIDPATFEAAQSRIESNKSTGRPATKTPRLLAGILKCGECGTSMYAKSSGKGRHIKSVFHCGSFYSSTFAEPTCSGKRHPAEELEAVVWEGIAQMMSEPELLQKAAERASSPVAEDSWAGEEATAVRELADLDRQAERLARLYRKELIPEAEAERQLEEIARSRKAAEHRLSVARSHLAARDVAARGGDLGAVVERIRKGLKKASATQKRELLQAIFPPRNGYGIHVHPDGRLEARGVLGGDCQAKRESSETSTLAIPREVRFALSLAYARQARIGRPPGSRDRVPRVRRARGG